MLVCSGELIGVSNQRMPILGQIHKMVSDTVNHAGNAMQGGTNVKLNADDLHQKLPIHSSIGQ